MKQSSAEYQILLYTVPIHPTILLIATYPVNFCPPQHHRNMVPPSCLGNRAIRNQRMNHLCFHHSKKLGIIQMRVEIVILCTLLMRSHYQLKQPFVYLYSPMFQIKHEVQKPLWIQSFNKHISVLMELPLPSGLHLKIYKS